MSKEIPRLRMFAGPNGSGKSTLKSVIKPELLGIYINPDEIEQTTKILGFLDLNSFGIYQRKFKNRQKFKMNFALLPPILTPISPHQETRCEGYARYAG